MTDIEFAFRISEAAGKIYRSAKNCSITWPAHSLTWTRALGSLCCDEIASHFGGVPLAVSFEQKIKTLFEHHWISDSVKTMLNRLRDSGNKGTHPEKFVLSEQEYSDLALESLVMTRELLELVFQLRKFGAVVPEYEVLLAVEADLKELCYRALMDGCSESQYQIAMLLRKRASDLPLGAAMVASASDLGESKGNNYNALHVRSLCMFEQASETGHLEATYEYGLALATGARGQQMTATGESLIRTASFGGNVNALAHVGGILMRDPESCENDYIIARSYLERAAEHDHPGALSDLGIMFYCGLGMPSDRSSAFALTQRAARAGYPQAQYNTYVLLSNGDGVAINNIVAKEWLLMSSAAGFPNACCAVARLMRAGEIPSSGFIEIEALLISVPGGANVVLFDLAMLYFTQGDGAQHLLDAANYLQQCYERALEEKDTQLEQNCRKASPAVVKAMVSEMLNPMSLMTDAQKNCVIPLRYYFDEQGFPYPNRCERQLLYFENGKEYAKVKGMGSLAEQRALKDIMTGFPVRIFEPVTIRRSARKVASVYDNFPKVGRNDPCSCGSLKKFKKCCGR